jgi:hypothetical protein
MQKEVNKMALNRNNQQISSRPMDRTLYIVKSTERRKKYQKGKALQSPFFSTSSYWDVP